MLASKPFSPHRLPHIITRFRSVKKKWATNREAELPHETALNMIGVDLSLMIGEQKWKSIRLALQSPQKYSALINNWEVDKELVCSQLRTKGAREMRKFVTEAKCDEIPGLHENEIISDEDEAEPADQSDSDYIPATRLESKFDMENKGVSWEVEESFDPIISKDSNFDLLNSIGDIQLYLYPPGKVREFKPAAQKNGKMEYYIMNATSILPVLALELKDGDEVLDACAAPGGKSVAMLMTGRELEHLQVNDVSGSRLVRLRRMFKQMGVSENVSFPIDITRGDIMSNILQRSFSKILIDAPCSNDRESVTSDENNWFSSRRDAERRTLPDVQADLIISCARNLDKNGLLVYSTCTTQAAQNDGAVRRALEILYSAYGIEMEVLDCVDWMRRLPALFGEVFVNTPSDKPYGCYIVPDLFSNFGPMYVCKMRRRK